MFIDVSPCFTERSEKESEQLCKESRVFRSSPCVPCLALTVVSAVQSSGQENVRQENRRFAIFLSYIFLSAGRTDDQDPRFLFPLFLRSISPIGRAMHRFHAFRSGFNAEIIAGNIQSSLGVFDQGLIYVIEGNESTMKGF